MFRLGCHPSAPWLSPGDYALGKSMLGDSSSPNPRTQSIDTLVFQDVSNDDGLTIRQLEQRCSHRGGTARSNTFDEEFDAVRRQPALVRGRRRHPVEDSSDEAGVPPRQTTAQRRKVYMQTEKNIRFQSKDKKCARISYQIGMGIHTALMQIQWQHPSAFIATMGRIRSACVREVTFDEVELVVTVTTLAIEVLTSPGLTSRAGSQ